MGGGDERRAAYARELGRIPLAYGRELERVGRLDGNQFAWRALDALRAEPRSWGDTPVFVYGFDDLTPLQRDAVETLGRVAGAEVAVSLTFEAGRSALDARAEVVAELRAVAERVHELPALEQYYAPASRPVLHHLERRLFEPGPDRVAAGEALALLEAGGELAEAEAIGAEVRRLIAAGVPDEEIAIVMRSPERIGPLLTEVLTAYGVAVDSGLAVRFAHTALGRAVRGLIRCALPGSAPARVEDLLAFLRHPGAGDAAVADRLEAECREAGVTRALEAVQERPELLALPRQLAEAADPAAGLTELARELGAAAGLDPGGPLGADGEAGVRALGALLSALGEAAELGERLDGEELLRLVDELEVPPAGGRRGVRLSDPLAIRAQRYRTVIVAGLVEGGFPAQATAEPFLSDEDRRELAQASGLRLAPSEDALPRERYLFYASVSRASERVVLVYRSSDEEGNLVLPSPFIADVAELLEEGWADRRGRRLLADVVWPVEEAPTPRERARSLAAAGAAAPGAVPAGAAPAERRLSERALRWVRHRRIVSAGALESHADCPMRWLVDRQLQPNELGPQPEPLGRGELAHGVLDRVISTLSGPLDERSLDDVLDRADEELRRASGRYARDRTDVVRSALTRGLRADLRRYLAAEAADNSEFQPRRTELRFGFDSTDEWPSELPVVLAGGEEPVLLRGMIDRIDVESGGGRAVVRDYKTGRSYPEWSGRRWVAEHRIQVALYMIAVRELLGLDVVGGFYQPLRGPDLRMRGVFAEGEPVGDRVSTPDGVAGEEIDTLLDQARELAVTVAGEIRAGTITPRPGSCSRDGCRHPGLCRL